MTFVVIPVNTDVMSARAPMALAMEKRDPHGRLVNLLRGLLPPHGTESQQSIADATRGDVSQSSISYYLNGTRRAKIGAALAIGRAFKVRPEYFTDPGGDGLDYRAYVRGASMPDWPELIEYLAAHPELEREEAELVDDVREQARTHGSASLSYRAIDLFVQYRRALKTERAKPAATSKRAPRRPPSTRVRRAT